MSLLKLTFHLSYFCSCSINLDFQKYHQQDINPQNKIFDFSFLKNKTVWFPISFLSINKKITTQKMTLVTIWLSISCVCCIKKIYKLNGDRSSMCWNLCFDQSISNFCLFLCIFYFRSTSWDRQVGVVEEVKGVLIHIKIVKGKENLILTLYIFFYISLITV